MNELEQLKRVLNEVAELRAELEELQKCPSEPSQISALPEIVQDYLHQLDETVLESAHETIEVLARLNLELRKSLNVQAGSQA